MCDGGGRQKKQFFIIPSSINNESIGNRRGETDAG